MFRWGSVFDRPIFRDYCAVVGVGWEPPLVGGEHEDEVALATVELDCGSTGIAVDVIERALENRADDRGIAVPVFDSAAGVFSARDRPARVRQFGVDLLRYQGNAGPIRVAEDHSVKLASSERFHGCFK